MRTFIADIIPKIQRFSQKLDDLTKLTDQHWVSLGDIEQSKRVFIFRPNNQLLISTNGIVEKGTWEYLGNQSLLLDTKHESYLLKHGFFDENVIALKLDSTDSYAFFVNETKFQRELNSIEDILNFLENRYLRNNSSREGLGSTNEETINEKYGFEILSEIKDFDPIWGKYVNYQIKFSNGKTDNLYKGQSSGRFFYLDSTFGKCYFDKFEDAVYNFYLYLNQKNNR